MPSNERAPHPITPGLDPGSLLLQRLLGMLCDDDSSPLPPRVEALLRATQLRLAALLD